MGSEKNIKKSNKVNKIKKTNIQKKNRSFSKKIEVIKKLMIKHKSILICLLWGILDVCLIIYVARSNSVNYVNVNGEDILVGDAKNLLFGRNYITLVVSLFIYIYFIVVNKMMLKIKMEKKYFIWLLVGILLFNMILFFMFTKRVY